MKVKNFKGLERDKKTTAILNTDKTAYDRYVREKNHRLIQKEELDSRVQGKVTFYDEEKGFGFIKNPLNQDSYFFHFSECEDLLSVGDKVEFELIRGEKGMNAVKILKQ